MLALKNLAISAVATAPTPADSGTTLVVTAGHGTRFPNPATDGAFYVTVWPTAATPDPSNAEVALCTGRATDTLTIVRAQDDSSARTIVAGDQIMLAVTAAVWAETRTRIVDVGFVSGLGRT